MTSKMQEPLNIRNQELRRVRVGDLEDAPWNFRSHPSEQEQALADVIDELGFYGYPDCYLTDDGILRICDGHLRKSLLVKKYGADTEIDVNVVDFDEAEARKATLTHDPLAALAEADATALDSLLRSVDTNSEALQAMFAGLAEEAGMFSPDEVDAPELADGDRAPFQQMTFTLHDSQAEIVKEAMEAAKAKGPFENTENENSNGNALARIVEAYLGKG
jgi:hypothetical protein